MNNIKGVIFDYGRTLHEDESNQFLDNAKDVIQYLSKKYKLAIVSITWLETMEKRWKQIRDADLEKYFVSIELVPTPEEKERAFNDAIKKFGCSFHEVAIVDDRTVRGIKWGNQKGCVTIWLQKGKFSQELPNEETGQPSFIIKELNELKKYL